MTIRHFRRLAALTAEDKILLLRVYAVVVAFRIALWLVPFRRVLARDPRVGSAANPRDPSTVERLAWAVQATARRVPRATCLTQAMALRWLLVAAGKPATLHVGVDRRAGRFSAHAWVECEGRRLLDEGSHSSEYSPILSSASR